MVVNTILVSVGALSCGKAFKIHLFPADDHSFSWSFKLWKVTITLVYIWKGRSFSWGFKLWKGKKHLYIEGAEKFISVGAMSCEKIF